MNKSILVLLLAISNMAFASIDHVVPTGKTIEGEYIIKLQGNLSMYNLDEIESSLNVKIIRRISNLSQALLVKVKDEKAAGSLFVNPMIVTVDANEIVTLQSTVNDPEFGKLWGLKNTGTNDPRGLPGKAGYDVNAEKAWDITTGSEDVIVAVIDTGVDPNIADLKNNMWVNQAEKNGQPGVDDDGNGFVDDIHGYDFVNKDGNPTDDHGHGSHVAGTIAAEGNNGTEVVGVAWKAKIMAVKFLSGSGSGSLADAISAIDYATQMGAHFSNNSWGGGGYNAELKAAIERANAANSGFIVAAGNQSNNNDNNEYYPCSYEVDNVLCVAALSSDGSLAEFSSYGFKKVDVAAPGKNILSTTPQGLKVFSGTSMATPHVAGAVVLLLSQHPELTPAQVRERVMRTSRPNYKLKGKVGSGGMLDAYTLLTNETHPEDPEDPTNWNQMDYSISTAHPYTENTDVTYEVTVPGASEFVVYFDKFDLENIYDKVTFKDAAGTVIGTMTGLQHKSFSPSVKGQKLFIHFKADNLVHKYGFDITKVYYK